MRGYNLVGFEYGYLTVEKQVGINKHGERIWLCHCKCGGKSEVKTSNLRKGKTRSCGCLRHAPRHNDLVGKIYTRLTVLEYAGKVGNTRSSQYKCRCECGKIRIVLSKSLISGITKSCGCWHKDRLKSQKGDKSPTWNPNLTEKDREDRRNLEECRVWKQAIKKNNDYTCCVCNIRGGDLVSHHLESYHANKELRTEIANGVCLCKKCHVSFHKKFGWKNNTKQQFEKFKEWKQEKSRTNNERTLYRNC